jgi:hypothetical protein
MEFLIWPGGLIVLIGFGIAYGWILHLAVNQLVYKLSGFRFADSYVLCWLLGLVSAVTPMFFYMALSFDEFADTPDGQKLRRRLRGAARFELLFLAAYGAVVLLTVPQR